MGSSSTRHGRPGRARRPDGFSRTSSTAPHLESRRYAHQRPVVGELAQLADYIIHLGAGHQPGAYHRLPYVLHRNLRHPLALAIAESRHGDPDAHLDQPSLKRHSQQAHPDRRVPSLLRTGNGLVELQVAVESSVGRVTDVAAMFVE